MAASSAAERASVKPELRAYRGRQVVLVFSGQGMGNFTNICVILISMAIFGQTGPQSSLTFEGARSTLALMYGFGAFSCAVMVFYRFMFLHESEVRFWGMHGPCAQPRCILSEHSLQATAHRSRTSRSRHDHACMHCDVEALAWAFSRRSLCLRACVCVRV